MKPTTLLVRATRADIPVPMLRKHVRWDPKTGRDRTMIYRHPPKPLAPGAKHAENDVSKLAEVKVDNVSFYRRAIIAGDLEEVKPARPSKAKAPKIAEG